MTIKIGDVVTRKETLKIAAKNPNCLAATHPEIGDVVEIKNDRCRVAWRSREVPSFYRPETETVIRPGKKTWLKCSALATV